MVRLNLMMQHHHHHHHHRRRNCALNNDIFVIIVNHFKNVRLLVEIVFFVPPFLFKSPNSVLLIPP